MRISRLELTNYRTFGHVVMEDIPDVVVLVSPNGHGKSSLLEAIMGAHDLVTPYHQDNYPFMMAYQKQHVPVWPEHLPEPVKLGEHSAEVKLEIEANGSELSYLESLGETESVGKVEFTVLDGRHVVALNSNQTAKLLCRYHNPLEGVGFIDYIRPVRYYRSKPLGDFAGEMRDDRTRQVISEFHRPTGEHDKFSGFKSFVVSSQLNDFSVQQAEGIAQDSLAEFREVFDLFFAPKRFLGYRTVGSAGPPQVMVETPFGAHDIDVLSDGEKEALHIFGHLFRFRHLHNVVLWDTPELHMNAALESRLFSAIRRLAPNNQFWIATHSVELINSVPLESLYVIRQSGPTVSLERPASDERRFRIEMYRELGAQIGLQLVSSVVVFVEGKNSSTDKLLLDRVIAPSVPGVNFVAGGSSSTVLAAGTRANEILQQASVNGDFLAIIDRDYMEDDEREALITSYRGRVFIWECHEIENIFLTPEVLYRTLQFMGYLDDEETEDSVSNDLKEAAHSLVDWIAADWLAWSRERGVQPPSRRISGIDPKGSLLTYVTALKEKVARFADVAAIESDFDDHRREVSRMIEASDGWRMRLPGKQLLKRFLDRRGRSPSEDQFLRVATGVIVTNGLVIPEFARLIELLRNIPR